MDGWMLRQRPSHSPRAAGPVSIGVHWGCCPAPRPGRAHDPKGIAGGSSGAEQRVTPYSSSKKATRDLVLCRVSWKSQMQIGLLPWA